MSSPPTNGPPAVASVPIPDHSPMARARSSLRKDAWMIDREPGTSSAAPTPWSSRPATSSGTDGASPHSTDAAENQTSPTAKTRRRPKRSPKDPPSRIRLASASR